MSKFCRLGGKGFRQASFRGQAMSKRLLLLEDGTLFEGEAFGADLDVTGELIFTSSQTGYQEIITDLSYTGQILVFSAPSVGNTGISREDYESIIPTCKGVVVRDGSKVSDTWRSQMSLDAFLKLKKIPAIKGIDTRALMRKIRQAGSMRATMANVGDQISHMQDQLQATVLQTDHVKQVSTKNPYPAPGGKRNIVLIDLGLKHSMLRALAQRDCTVTVLPYDTSAETVRQLFPDGVFLSNGPGDPSVLSETLDLVHQLQGEIPLFGIGLGHELIALANGAQIDKLAICHRGNALAVREIATGQVHFTSQNHGYIVNRQSLPEGFFITHENALDQTIAGLRHRHLPVLSVQFNPEASPGSHDLSAIFDECMEMIEAFLERKTRR